MQEFEVGSRRNWHNVGDRAVEVQGEDLASAALELPNIPFELLGAGNEHSRQGADNIVLWRGQTLSGRHHFRLETKNSKDLLYRVSRISAQVEPHQAGGQETGQNTLLGCDGRYFCQCRLAV